jgi:hypothetical protein
MKDKRYTEEYKRALMAAVDSGVSIRRVSWEHDVPVSTLRGWLKRRPVHFDTLPLFAQFRFPGGKGYYVKAAADTYHLDVPGFPALFLIGGRPRADRFVIPAAPQLPNVPPPADTWIEWRIAVRAAIVAERGERCDRPTWSELSAYFQTNYHPRVAAAEWMKSHPAP